MAVSEMYRYTTPTATTIIKTSKRILMIEQCGNYDTLPRWIVTQISNGIDIWDMDDQQFGNFVSRLPGYCDIDEKFEIQLSWHNNFKISKLIIDENGILKIEKI